MTPGRRGWIVLVFLAIGAALIAGASRTYGAEPHEHTSRAGRFYATWMQPDAPWVSCCHEQDCAAAASKFEGGTWYSRWSEEEAWVAVPAAKVDELRETPDGRSHMCGRRAASGEFYVFCFVRGGGA